MNNTNLAIIEGVLARPPLLEYTKNNKPYVTGTLSGTDEDGQKFFTNFVRFGNSAERIAAMQPGEALMIEGRVKSERWKDQHGNWREKTYVLAGRDLPANEMSYGKSGNNSVQGYAGVNHVIVQGRLVAEPETRTTTDGKMVTNLTIASHEEGKTEPMYLNVRVWGEPHGVVKGQTITIIGTLMNDSWTDGDGKRRYVAEITASQTIITPRRAQ